MVSELVRVTSEWCLGAATREDHCDYAARQSLCVRVFGVGVGGRVAGSVSNRRTQKNTGIEQRGEWGNTRRTHEKKPNKNAKIFVACGHKTMRSVF